MVTVVRLT